ncbi:GNAT family N-acetyltransferase [Actinomadura litoris]|uniref:GNAT family N-acetyltransferase n=1 Tax=Actinomadura litoris TaxID=2678616 RepID=UPI001FA755F8|nr:GNAT family N-acetyltransferase [Actinomadura litoris]
MTPSQSQPSPAVRVAAAADVAAVSAVLGRAFEDDPVWRWIVPDEASRVRRLTALFSIQLRTLHLRHGGAETGGRGPRVEGAALWDPPGHWRVPLRTYAASTVPLIRALGTRTPAALRALAEIEKHHPREPHWYLAVLGTDPSAQGNGLGSALLRSRLDRCDAKGLPAYLESSNPVNIPFYTGFGFRVTRDLTMPGSCPPIQAMWRDPQ